VEMVLLWASQGNFLGGQSLGFVDLKLEKEIARTGWKFNRLAIPYPWCFCKLEFLISNFLIDFYIDAFLPVEIKTDKILNHKGHEGHKVFCNLLFLSFSFFDPNHLDLSFFEDIIG
jgi:hypothetical protein